MGGDGCSSRVWVATGAKRELSATKRPVSKQRVVEGTARGVMTPMGGWVQDEAMVGQEQRVKPARWRTTYPFRRADDCALDDAAQFHDGQKKEKARVLKDS